MTVALIVLALAFGLAFLPQMWIRGVIARHSDERPDFAGTGGELTSIMRKAPPAISAFVLLLGIGACSHRGDASEGQAHRPLARVSVDQASITTSDPIDVRS